MQHPILHHQHTERPIGTITKAEIIDEGLYIEASIYDTADTDDVWDEILSGKLNKYSIYARRLKGTPSCRVSPESRTSPCVTKALTLWSISAVGDNAINPSTFLEVIKALRGDDVTDEEVVDVIEKAEDESPKDEETLLKAETNVSGILDRIGSLEEMTKGLPEFIEKCSGYFQKADETDEEVEKCGCAEKAEPVEEPADIVKADVIQKAIDDFRDEIRKAYDEKFAAMEARVAKMEEETIRKGGVVVIHPEEMTPEERKGLNPMILNAKAVGGI